VAAGIDPVIHFVEDGAREGRNPNPLFDTVHYLDSNPEVRNSGVNPLVHYLNTGSQEGRDPSPSFDTKYYVAQNPDVAAAGVNPLAHYLATGQKEGRQAYPEPIIPVDQTAETAARISESGLFDPAWYLTTYPDVAAAGVDPVVHFVADGVLEGRSPSALFDTSFYLSRNPDVGASGVNPLLHYLTEGAAEGRDPSALFDSSYYLESSPDVRASGMNPLGHYLTRGVQEERNPNPLFDTGFYFEKNWDVFASGINPLVHYLTCGAQEGRDPGPLFDSHAYLAQNPDVAAAGLNPLAHHLGLGEQGGGQQQERPLGRELALPAGLSAARHTSATEYLPPTGLLPWFNPLNLYVDPSLAAAPRLNVLAPGLGMRHMSGGPNTIIALATRLALAGIPIRFLSTEAAPDPDQTAFWDHAAGLAGTALPAHLALVDASNRRRRTPIGEHDLFLATAWWTAQQAKYATRLTRTPRFVYLIQDYEPLLHAASTQQALASETYGLDHIPVVNSSLLLDYLVGQKVGRFKDPEFARAALMFEPALDRSLFHPDPRERSGERRRLLFYARPQNGLRNLFELGVASLQKALADGVFDPLEWEFIGMGEQFRPVRLQRGAVLKPAPWLDLHGYARQMRGCDLLLSPMMSPHPSYPPLEMAASGGVVVTTSHANKDARRLAALSPNIIGSEPTIEAMASALGRAVERTADKAECRAGADIALPQNWDEAFAPILSHLVGQLRELQGSPSFPSLGQGE